MKLTPLDIRKQEFQRSFRGFDRDEVRNFLDIVATQWDEMANEQRRLEARVRELENKLDHYEKVEEALQEALQTARENAEQKIQNAEDKAALIIEQAEANAKTITQEAREANERLKRETSTIDDRRGEIVARLRAFLMSEMELLARFTGDDPVGFIKLLPAEERKQLRQAGVDLNQLSGTIGATEGATDEAETAVPEAPAEEAPALLKKSLLRMTLLRISLPPKNRRLPSLRKRRASTTCGTNPKKRQRLRRRSPKRQSPNPPLPMRRCRRRPSSLRRRPCPTPKKPRPPTQNLNPKKCRLHEPWRTPLRRLPRRKMRPKHR